jgi:hypothetical protein
MNTMNRPLNIPIQPPRQPINRPRPRAEGSSNPQSAPLWRHPRWTYFLSDLNEIIMQHTPSLRPHFLELLSRIDTI